MTHCTRSSLRFSNSKRRKVEANFQGGAITGNGGALLLKEAERALGLGDRISRLLPDTRRQSSCKHSVRDMIRQRVHALALGYEDLNDHDSLRDDPALQTALGRETPLASSPTLSRFERQADRSWITGIHEILIEWFIESFAEPPEELILDFDATDDLVHGNQEHGKYHGYYGNYCFLPLYVFCNDQLLTAYLRPGNADAAGHAGAILNLLVKRLRQQWPDVRIILRADAGFCRWRTMSWCERNGVKYILGVGRNPRLTRLAQPLIDTARDRFAEKSEKQRLFGEVQYEADPWKCKRRVIVKAEHMAKGQNPRYVVTNLSGDPQELYDRVYCARGEMENRIKEQQLDLFADRTSSTLWHSNQFRMVLSGLAYVLLEYIRRHALRGTRLARAYVRTIRLKLLRIGAVVVHNTRRIVFMLSSNYPYRDLFRLATQRLAPG